MLVRAAFAGRGTQWNLIKCAEETRKPFCKKLVCGQTQNVPPLGYCVSGKMFRIQFSHKKKKHHPKPIDPYTFDNKNTNQKSTNQHWLHHTMDFYMVFVIFRNTPKGTYGGCPGKFTKHEPATPAFLAPRKSTSTGAARARGESEDFQIKGGLI